MRNPTAWRTMDTPPTEEDGYILVWAENMPVSMGCCENNYYLLMECEDPHNYFEGGEHWFKEHWTLWMHLPDPSGKIKLADTHRIVPVELLNSIMELAGVALVYQPFGTKDRQNFDALMAIIEDKQ